MKWLHPFCHDLVAMVLPNKLHTNSPSPHQHLPHCKPVLLHLQFGSVVCIELIRKINTLYFVIVKINHSGDLNIGNSLVPKNKWKEGFVVLVFPWFLSPPLNDFLSWIHCWHHCDNVVVHPTENMEAIWIIIVIESIKSLIINPGRVWLQLFQLTMSIHKLPPKLSQGLLFWAIHHHRWW